MKPDRIIIETPTDYAWPYVAVLKEYDWRDQGWHEIDAMGGDSISEAVEELRACCSRARKAEVSA